MMSFLWWYVTLGLLILLLVVIELDRRERERLEQRYDRLRAKYEQLMEIVSEDHARAETFDAIIDDLHESSLAAKVDRQWKGIRCESQPTTEAPTSSVPPESDAANRP
jgi:hypothetical protein